MPGAPARGWEERNEPIAKLAQGRGDERVCVRRACRQALQAGKAVERRAELRIEFLIFNT